MNAFRIAKYVAGMAGVAILMYFVSAVVFLALCLSWHFEFKHRKRDMKCVR